MATLPIEDLVVQGKNVLVRVDFNVPMDEKGRITDDTRIEAVLPTIRYIIERGGRPVLMSHLGRPKGKKDLKYSLAPCAKRLSMMLGRPVIMAKDCVGEEVEQLASQLKPGESLLLENLRFHEAEEHPEKDPTFARHLAKLGECYVNDAFGTAHRCHASTFSIVEYFHGKASPGFLMRKELQFLGDALLKPKRPFYGLIGGAKVSSKLGVIKALIKKVDTLLIGGAMAFTFLKARGVSIGSSLFEPELVDTARAVMNSFNQAGVRLLLPQDHVVVKTIDANAEQLVVTNEKGIPDGYYGVDIGPATIHSYSLEFTHASTLFWNGPMGVFELAPFGKGTRALAEALAPMHGVKIVGGGDSVAAIRSMNLAHQFTHLSTGGGAALEYIEHGSLPGVKALEHSLSLRTYTEF